jgi:hypothetical protein
MSETDVLETLADFCALCYHEARNVRFLIRKGFANADKYGPLRELSTDRYEAWRALQSIRWKARRDGTAVGVKRLFEQRFRIGLPDLVILFQNQGWRHSSRGGNQWANIASTVSDLGRALEDRDLERADAICLQLAKIRHNNGYALEKLRELDKWLVANPQKSPPNDSDGGSL